MPFLLLFRNDAPLFGPADEYIVIYERNEYDSVEIDEQYGAEPYDKIDLGPVDVSSWPTDRDLREVR